VYKILATPLPPHHTTALEVFSSCVSSLPAQVFKKQYREFNFIINHRYKVGITFFLPTLARKKTTAYSHTQLYRTAAQRLGFNVNVSVSPSRSRPPPSSPKGSSSKKSEFFSRP